MKNIKEYIIEANIIDALKLKINDWLEKYGVMEFMRKIIPKKIPVKFSIRNNMIYPDQLSIEITDHVPSYIQFNKRDILNLLKNKKYQYIALSRINVNQSDISRLGAVTAIRNAQYAKNLDIDTYDSISFDNIFSISNVNINFQKKSGSVELKLLNMSYREILNININSKAPIKLVLDVQGSSYSNLIDKLNNDEIVTDHIINNLHCNSVYETSGNEIIFTNPINIEEGKWIKA